MTVARGAAAAVNDLLPPSVEAAEENGLTDIDALRAAMRGVTTLFLLVPNVPDELTQAISALNLTREAGVRGIVYLSVFKGEAYVDAPHFTGKHAVERMIAALGLPATVLRPAYFMQNDLMQQEPLLGAGLYGAPIGHRGISMVDTRDIAEAAALGFRVRLVGIAVLVVPVAFAVPSPSSTSRAASASCTSEPVATMRTFSSPSASASV